MREKVYRYRCVECDWLVVLEGDFTARCPVCGGVLWAESGWRRKQGLLVVLDESMC